MEDKEMLMAIFNSIGALAERITGEIPLLCIKGQDGAMYHIYPNTSNVTWFNQKMEAASQHGGLEVPHSIYCAFHGASDAKTREPLQVVEPLAKS